MDRSYTLVWLGVSYQIDDPRELERLRTRSHELIARAEELALGWYFDSFGFDDEGQIYLFLIGSNLGMLGFKEGVTHIEINPDEIAGRLKTMSTGLRASGITDPPALHVLFHVEDEDQ